MAGYHEDDLLMFDGKYLLRPETEIRHILQNAQGPVLLKPISETMVRTLEDVCTEFSAYQIDIVWLYRDPVNVLYSLHQKDWITLDCYTAEASNWCLRNEMALQFTPPPGVTMTFVSYEDLCANEELVAALGLHLNLDFYYNKMTAHRKLSADSNAGRKHVPDQLQQTIDAMTAMTRERLNANRLSVGSYLAQTGVSDLGSVWLENWAEHLNAAVSVDNVHLHARYDRGRTARKHILPPEISAEAIENVDLFGAPFYHLPFLCQRVWQGAAGIHRLRDQSWLALSYDAVEGALRQPALINVSRSRGCGKENRSNISGLLAPFVTAEMAASRSHDIAVMTRTILGNFLSTGDFNFRDDFSLILSASMYLEWLGIKLDGAGELYRDMRVAPTWERLESSLGGCGLIVDLVSQHPELKQNVAAWYNLLTGSFGMVCDFVDTAIYGLLQHPSWMSSARTQSHRISEIVSELLRLFPPVSLLERKAVDRCEVLGQTLHVGDTIYVAVSAANRDPRMFTDPDMFNIDRDLSPIYTFGGGNARCPGEAMARSAAQTILAVLLTEFPPLVPGAEFKFTSYSGVPFQHVPTNMYVRFDSQQPEN